MNNEDALLSLGTKAGFPEVQAYLKARGWQNVPSQRNYASIFRREHNDKTFEAVIPLDRGLQDYGDAMVRVAERVSAMEGRNIVAVLRDFVSSRRDVIRFALSGQSTEDGSVGLPNGYSLVHGARKAFLASACSAIKPKKYHPRMAFADAESFLRDSRLASVELGSFVLVVETPSLDIGSKEGTIKELPLPRRASEYLMRAVSRIERSIRASAAQSLLEETQGEPLVSANLCDALVEMMPSDESADLEIRATWAPVIPVPDSWPQSVRLDRSTYETIERIGQQLRPSLGDRESLFVGAVVKLAGQPGDSGQLEGEVQLQVLSEEEEEMLRVTLALGPEDYQKAGDAHLHNKYVSVRGTLHRGWRVHELKAPKDFQIINK